jgi:hypothetical protein
MEIFCVIAVIYVTADLIACAYVVGRRGGFKNTIADIKANLGITGASERDDDVYDRW